jgi:multicomponent Na+:H+ antiporter subunit C
VLPAVVADPLPQALILTAIVIGFGVLAFAMVLAYRAYQAVESDDLDDMRSTDALPPTEEQDVTETYDEARQSEPAVAERALPDGGASA